MSAVANFLQDSSLIDHILQSLLDLPKGRAALIRVAQSCRLLREPALDLLWGELDSLVPLIALFPAHLLRVPRRPQLGLSTMPEPHDWSRLLYYGNKVKRITYEQSSGSIAPSIFPIIDKSRPQPYILPNLMSLTWRAETLDGLARSLLFIHPDLQALNLEITAASSPATLFAEISSRARLTALSITSRQISPDAVLGLLTPQHSLRKLALNTPGCLSSAVGRWISFHPTLQSLSIDFAGASSSNVEEFFAHSRAAAGLAPKPPPPADVSYEVDWLSMDILSYNASFPRGSCPDLSLLRVSGEATTLALFMGHLNSQLGTIHVDVDYPAGETGWKYLFDTLREQHASTLHTLRIGASQASQASDRQRTATRGGLPVLRHFSLENFPHFRNCIVLDVQLPESAYLREADLLQLATSCPQLEFARLCPNARFPVALGAPKLALEGISPLTRLCMKLNTLHVVVNAAEGSEDVWSSSDASSASLKHLHLGNSWVVDPFQAALLLSHLAPNLLTLSWDATNKNRYSPNCLKLQGYLPHLQSLRRYERIFASRLLVPQLRLEGDLEAREVDTVKENPQLELPKEYVDREVWAFRLTEDECVQAFADMAECGVEAKPDWISVEVCASPAHVDREMMTASPVQRSLTHHSVQTSPVEPVTADAAFAHKPPFLTTETNDVATASVLGRPRSPLQDGGTSHPYQNPFGDYMISLVFWPFLSLFQAFPFYGQPWHTWGNGQASEDTEKEKDLHSEEDLEDP